jgi:hypothetical protein
MSMSPSPPRAQSSELRERLSAGRGTRCCCASWARTRGSARRDRGSRLRRLRGSLSWLLPATLLALMPKCPVCVAAYVALLTGVGITIPAAAAIRTAMIAACLASLAFLTLRMALRGMAVARFVSSLRACGQGPASVTIAS